MLPFLAPCLLALAGAAPAESVTVEILEGIPDKRSWEFKPPQPSARFTEPVFGFVGLPRKFSAQGVVTDRSNPLVLRATGTVTLPAGEHRFLLRARNASRLYLDDRLILETAFLNPNASGHESVPERRGADAVYPLPAGSQEKEVTVPLDGKGHTFRLETFVGGQKLRLELGDVCVGVARPGGPFRVLSPKASVALDDEGWSAYAEGCRARLRERDRAERHAAAAAEAAYWRKRHDLARKVGNDQPAVAVPKVSSRTPVHNAIDHFIGSKLESHSVTPAPLTDDHAFLRRVTLDTTGVIPTRQEVAAFLQDRRRDRAIDRLLADPRWADHWVSYWQDVLAENPGILKPTLNNTGPFRWWLHEALEDNLSMDRLVTELLRMEGSKMFGGPAGFSLATQNDVPMAAKAHIVAKAFLGLEMGCARCHDAPHHPFKQEELFHLAAMLGKGPITVPATSSVKPAERTRRPLIEVTLEPGAKVEPTWPFPGLAPVELPAGVLRNPDDSRERLAALLTSPRNERFAQVLVNRLWKRYLGWGLVEPVDDWKDDTRASHPELLRYLARELVTHDYDLKHVARLILNSHAYQRQVLPETGASANPDQRLFAAPARRRLSAEQVVDSLFAAAGKEFGSEELTMDPEGRRPVTEMQNLGRPRRAWEFTSLSNERDRPALAIPMAQSIVDVLTVFGWRDSRQNPITVREETPTPLQPLVLANGIAGSRVCRLSDDSALTALALEDRPLPDLIRAVFVQVLSRPPSAEEMKTYTDLLEEDYATRRTKVKAAGAARRPGYGSAVSWSNHLSPEATRIKMELERRAREGDPPTARLQADWRERLEDMVWSLVNAPEFLFVP